VEDAAMTAALRAAGAGVIASFCLEGGVLTGKYRAGPVPGRAAGGRHRRATWWAGEARASGAPAVALCR
jgi:aryl-alcohol dehydrogenase-like predicted oxidoreductase